MFGYSGESDGFRQNVSTKPKSTEVLEFEAIHGKEVFAAIESGKCPAHWFERICVEKLKVPAFKEVLEYGFRLSATFGNPWGAEIVCVCEYNTNPVFYTQEFKDYLATAGISEQRFFERLMKFEQDRHLVKFNNLRGA